MGSAYTVLMNKSETSITSRKYFIDKLLEEDLVQLNEDIAASAAYAAYIKSGLWIESLSTYFNNEKKLKKKLTPGQRLIKELDCPIYEYDVPPMISFQKLLNRSKRSFSSTDSSSFSRSKNGESIKSNRSVPCDYDMYVKIHEKTILSVYQLTAMLLAIIYPTYKNSPQFAYWQTLYDDEPYEQEDQVFFCDSGISGLVDADEDIGLIYNRSNGTKKVQLLLESAAAKHEEDRIVEIIRSNTWIPTLLNFIDSMPYGLTLCSASDPSFPIILTNKTFRAMTGHANEDSLLGKDLRSLLWGSQTEEIQQSLWNDAINQGLPARIGITHYTSNKKAYLSLAAIQPVYDADDNYKYVIVLHMDCTNDTPHSKVLSGVDSMLLLLTRLIIRPR